MFETLFQYPAVVARHRSGPFAEARERFLNHCASQGFARATLLVYARELLVIAGRIDITMGEAIGLSTIEAAANRWAGEQPRTGFTSWVVWQCPNPRSCLSPTGSLILRLISETHAVCPRPPFVVKAGMWRSSGAGWASRIVVSTMFLWKMWMPFWLPWESGVGAVCR